MQINLASAGKRAYIFAQPKGHTENPGERRCQVTLKQIVKSTLALSVAGVIVLAAVRPGPLKVHADEQDSDQELSEIGLRIAPVQLNLAHKDPMMVGLGSYIVNAQSDCNGCHTSNPMGAEFGSNNNPYLLPPLNNKPWQVQAEYYLGGGQNFGPVGPGVSSGPYASGPGTGPLIISRNLTPDYTGLPEGGHTLEQFLKIMRTGHDYDKLHPNCGESVTTNCYNPPTNGELLQVMPWPAFRQMTDHQLTAIWIYLSAIPCIANTGSPYPNLVNQCP